jgi:hypothetical protein
MTTLRKDPAGSRSMNDLHFDASCRALTLSTTAIPSDAKKYLLDLRQKFWRRESGSNRRIRVLQTLALPLGYRATWVKQTNGNNCLQHTATTPPKSIRRINP